ncbi:MAG TPA: TIGR04563 family protein [Myxococcaceae bacterium]|nr:TIGR04563 family protein [Myxococcaceae bacterium]
MATTDHRKQSLYFPEEMLLEIQREALRQDRSLSWIVQQAWKLARLDIRRMPSVTDVLGNSGRAVQPNSNPLPGTGQPKPQ